MRIWSSNLEGMGIIENVGQYKKVHHSIKDILIIDHVIMYWHGAGRRILSESESSEGKEQ